MIAGILSLLGSSAFGSILGGVFAFMNKKADFEVKKLELSHEVEKWAHDLKVKDKDLEHDLKVKDKDLEYAKQEALGRKDVAIIEADANVEAARFAAIAAVQASDRITADEIREAGSWGWLFVIAATLNKLIRPLATIFLAGTAIYINMLLVGKLTEGWEQFTQVQRYEAAMQAFAWITGQAGAVLGYWFVSRGLSTK